MAAQEAKRKSKSEIETAVRQELHGTEYDVISLTPLVGGTANFIYRARLQTPLPDGTEDVVLKHGEGYVAQHPDFALTMLRCEIEEESLRLLSSFPHINESSYDVGTPKLYHFNPKTSTQIQEYLPNAVSLKDYALKHLQTGLSESAKPRCLQLGQSLGRWLRSFHKWSDEPERQGLAALFAKNTDMLKIKKTMNYDQLLWKAGKMPAVLGGCKDVLQSIVDMATAELQNESELRVIHGDFWTGNVLLPDAAFVDNQQVPVRIVDWEMAQVGVRPEDLGQLIAELWQLKLYKGIDAGLWIIQGFIEGYGEIDTQFAFRALVHVGAHLICIGSSTPGWGTEEDGLRIAEIGRDVLIHAWEKDTKAFKGHNLECVLRWSP